MTDPGDRPQGAGGGHRPVADAQVLDSNVATIRADARAAREANGNRGDGGIRRLGARTYRQEKRSLPYIFLK